MTTENEKRTVFLREEVSFNEGDLVEILSTGERILFGRCEYRVNWLYGIWDNRGNYFGQINKGGLALIKEAK